MASTVSTLRILPLLSIFLPAVSSLPNQYVSTKELSVRQVPSFTATGCVTDTDASNRFVDGGSYAADDMTIESCAVYCVNGSRCSMVCAGNATETCGAGQRANLFRNNDYVPLGPANLPGITSLGCFVDSGQPHVLPDNIISTNDMDAEACATHCAAYAYFGTE
ncbi:hypothetical protein B0H66DRAFT_598028 [Apodospora peruviana]|uniref:Apple domain-containing protein n=1 Tax=Apodospora peruviana TaxID=516989 RepID=A0AAE0IT13_9PEZI|nr:hypothetical protein B0H66DRAFT_598028 [Apodospora peruviana]